MVLVSLIGQYTMNKTNIFDDNLKAPTFELIVKKHSLLPFIL